ncbi:hypothetical protein PHYSODRAFT_339037 [Phytophthora sojae]|uniref:Uncharacterized protein n=1 Tax=Phytophthora sojae (strain P6497) TaxID=1094619 RepID=G5A5H6_PHYSP|nr:hypothetical protein PHYSODRAFT_339037 [Phytophthora sojae]EGZ08581.1 hypothetical protein PHYSODRAFT_339037 [Phytophthora sojae]|eukprot:XP_009535214.1 hypothetical protein PHYSODRAFT_339037 [Phytophthora sojae]
MDGASCGPARPKRVRGERQRLQDAQWRQRKKNERQQLKDTALQQEAQLAQLRQDSNAYVSPAASPVAKRRKSCWLLHLAGEGRCPETREDTGRDAQRYAQEGGG